MTIDEIINRLTFVRRIHGRDIEVHVMKKVGGAIQALMGKAVDIDTLQDKDGKKIVIIKD